MRVASLVRSRWRVLALTSSPQRVDALRALGVIPIVADLDDAASLGRMAALAPWVLHLAPPAGHGTQDVRTKHLLNSLARGGVVRRIVYVSTTGVYGDARGDWVNETRAVAPQTARAHRRVDAECRLRRFGCVHGTTVSVLRVPGIYALDRDGGNPIERVRQGSPVLVAEDDVYTNHIHADDLARACVAALMHGAPQRIYHVSDDGHARMGDHMDAVAHLAGLPKPPRITRSQAAATLSPMALSFWSESRRLTNQRLKSELRLRLRHATIATGLLAV